MIKMTFRKRWYQLDDDIQEKNYDSKMKILIDETILNIISILIIRKMKNISDDNRWWNSSICLDDGVDS